MKLKLNLFKCLLCNEDYTAHTPTGINSHIARIHGERLTENMSLAVKSEDLLVTEKNSQGEVVNNSWDEEGNLIIDEGTAEVTSGDESERNLKTEHMEVESTVI